MSTTHEFGLDTPQDTDVDLKDGFKDEDSVLADLRDEVTSETEDDIKWYTVPERPNIELAFNTSIEYDLLRAWLKRSTNKKTKDMEALRLSIVVLSNLTRGIRVRGNEVTKNGEPLSLQSTDVWELFGVNSMPQALSKIMKKDGHIIALMQQVISDAGYGDVDMEAEDPLSKG